MADVPVGNVPAPSAPAAPAAPAKTVDPIVAAKQARAEKLAKVSAGLSKLDAEATPAQAVKPPAIEALPSEKGPEAPKAEMPKEPEPPKEEEKPAEPPVEEKPAEKKSDEEVDPKTAKGLAAIDKQAKKFREEQAQAKRAFDAEMAQMRADIAREQAEMRAKYAPVDELQKLAKRDPIAALRKLGIDSEDEWETVGRGAFPFTKAGKTDPRAAELAARTQREREYADRMAELEQKHNTVLEKLEAMERQAQSKQIVEEYASGVIKAIPAEASLIGKLHAKAPAKARQALLELAAKMEAANDGETPEYGDVITEYERVRRAELEEQGVDVDAMLKPAVAPKATAAGRTIDPATPTNGVRPINGTPSREQKLAAINAGLRKLEADA